VVPFDPLDPVQRRPYLHGGGHTKVLALLAVEEDAEPFKQKMKRLVAQLREQRRSKSTKNPLRRSSAL
jgi:hypothetical protein